MPIANFLKSCKRGSSKFKKMRKTRRRWLKNCIGTTVKRFVIVEQSSINAGFA